MNVTCADCASVFRVDPAKVPAAGVLARCSVCGAVIPVRTAGSTPSSSPVDSAVGALVGVAEPALTSPAGVATTTTAASDAGSAERAPPTPARASPRITPRSVEPQAPVTAVLTESGSGVPVQPRRFNPFLSNDPSQKARRLARALVSDLVAYNPQKREEGLRAGNLKELFRDEIRKSWAEYVEQVGAPIAEGTTHFQDALNDVLAGGRKVF